MDTDIFSETTNAIAAAVPCDAGTVRAYCDWGWIECRRISNGVRLLKPSAVEKVRKLRTERLARRGGNHQQPKVLKAS
jgi:hypothetical protein